MTEASEVEADTDWRTFEPLRLPPLMHHGLHEFVAHGYDGTTVRTVAKRAGQTVPSIYYHYENKQGLLVALLDLAVDDLLRRVADAIGEAGPTPTERFSRFVEALVLYVANQRELALLDNEIRSLEPPNRDEYVGKRDRIEGWLGRIIDEGLSAGAFDVEHPREARRAIIAMCRGIVDWYDPSGPISPSDLAQRYIGFALRIVRSGTGSARRRGTR